MIRVVIADDEALVRGGLRMILEGADDIRVVGEAADGSEAVTLAREHLPDVLLTDIRMPKTDGLYAVRAITQDPNIATRVLVLTTFDLDEYVYDAIKAGASGFLLKTVPPTQLINAVRDIVSGEVLLAPAIAKRLIERFMQNRDPKRSAEAHFSELTDRERDVLRLIAKGLTNAEIADSLFVTEATVKTHINRILSKLGLRDRIQVVVAAYETGFVAPGSD
ncbi:MAG: response regulator [Actinomycetota bacterium]